jgi:hypothetical protein
VNRYKYLDFSLDGLSLNSLCKKMQSDLYSERRSSGFLIDEARRDYVLARYIKKIPIENEVISPAGEKFTQNYTVYETVVFEIRRDFIGLVLKNPPRSINSFISAFGILTDFKKPVRSVQVGLNIWLKNIHDGFGDNVVLKVAECEGVKFKDNATGSLKVSSNEALDVTMKCYLGDRKFGLKKMKLEIEGNIVTLNKNCTFSSNVNDQGFIARLCKTLESSIIH